MSKSIFDTLRDDHDSQRALIRELRMRTDSAERRALFRSLRDEIRAHGRSEERVLYERLRDSPVFQSDVAGWLGEHEEIDRRLQELEHARIDAPDWAIRFERLADLAERHMAAEEKQIFSLADQELDDDECRALNLDYGREKSSRINT